MSRVVHFELAAADPEALVEFYEDTLGWEAERWEGPVEYWLLTTGDDDRPGIDGAIMRRDGDDPRAGTPVAGAICTAEVDDIDAAIEGFTAHGGEALVEPQEVPGVGRHAYVRDPAGNQLGLMEPLGGS